MTITECILLFLCLVFTSFPFVSNSSRLCASATANLFIIFFLFSKTGRVTIVLLINIIISQEILVGKFSMILVNGCRPAKS